MSNWKNGAKRKKIVVTAGMVIGIVLLIILIYFVWTYFQKPLVSMKYHKGSEKDTIVVDVKVSKIRKNFQAASFIISFDEEALTLEKINQGNIKVKDSGNKKTKLPSWECNPDVSNKTGKVSIMYLDMSAVNAPFVKRKTSGILYQIVFKINNPDMVKQNTKLKIEQATFASVKEEKSLSMKKRNIRTENLKIQF